MEKEVLLGSIVDVDKLLMSKDIKDTIKNIRLPDKNIKTLEIIVAVQIHQKERLKYCVRLL